MSAALALPYDEVVRSVIMDVSPAMAAEWLTHNTSNRRPKPARVTAYARDMRNDAWKMTGESIKFAKGGLLLDGQNRLAACVVSGKTVTMMVIFGLDRDAQEAMDAGASRSSADQLALRGYTNTKATAAIAAVMLGYRAGRFVNTGSAIAHSAPTRTEILDFADSTEDIQLAAHTAARVGIVIPLGCGPLGAAYLLFREIDAAQAYEFFTALNEHRTKGEGDPLFALTRRAANNRLSHRRLRTAEALYMLIRTWNAWRQDERLTKLLVTSQGQFIPLPEPI